jgi:RNA polymerase sigma-70 factor, ECF subfamily
MRNSQVLGQPLISDTAGDAFTRAVYDGHGTVLLRFALRLCHGDFHRAEDIVQETAVRAWQNRAMLDPSTPGIRTWLFRVIRNLVIDQHRSQLARPTEVNELNVAEPWIPDPAEQTVDWLVVADAMAELTAPQKEILLYMYYLGLSVSQASRALRIAPGTVKSRSHYAVRALRAALVERGVAF